MNLIRTTTAVLLAAAFLASPITLLAGDPPAATDKKAKAQKETKARPYPLDTCLVTDEKLGADPAMKTFSFVHGNQEIQLCCKGCKKDFDKDPGKYLSKLKAAEQSRKKDAQSKDEKAKDKKPQDKPAKG